MRTKALLLTAALGVAGVATSMAQTPVYSVNAVGYVNTVLQPGFNLISNPLIAADNSIATLFKGVPADTAVFKYTGTGFVSTSYDGDVGAFAPADVAAQTVVPGEGVFVKLPPGPTFTVTFVGEVSQGANLSHGVPSGLSIQSSQVPLSGTADTLGLVGHADDTIYQFNPTTQLYTSYSFDGDVGAWGPALVPLKVGEAFFFKNAGAATTWNTSFNVNTP